MRESVDQIRAQQHVSVTLRMSQRENSLPIESSLMLVATATEISQMNKMFAMPRTSDSSYENRY